MELLNHRQCNDGQTDHGIVYHIMLLPWWGMARCYQLGLMFSDLTWIPLGCNRSAKNDITAFNGETFCNLAADFNQLWFLV
jgi:hypothetical protein